jgi:hypothetical protein
MENLRPAIVAQYAHYLSVNFNEVYGVDREPLPKFAAYAVGGRLVIFAGRLTETNYGRLVKACEVFGYSEEYLEHRRAAA